jgi:hypothetical protein
VGAGEPDLALRPPAGELATFFLPPREPDLEGLLFFLSRDLDFDGALFLFGGGEADFLFLGGGDTDFLFLGTGEGDLFLAAGDGDRFLSGFFAGELFFFSPFLSSSRLSDGFLVFLVAFFLSLDLDLLESLLELESLELLLELLELAFLFFFALSLSLPLDFLSSSELLEELELDEEASLFFFFSSSFLSALGAGLPMDIR